MVIELFTSLVNNMGYLMAIAFGLTYINRFKRILEKENYTLVDKLLLSFLFSLIAILGTSLGSPFHGSLVSTRNIPVVVGAIIGGPIVGGISGIIAGIHRYLVDPVGITAIPCAIASASGGILIGLIKKTNNIDGKTFSFLAGAGIENISMALILVMSNDFMVSLEIVKSIYLPMVMLNSIGVLIIMSIIEEILKEKEREAGRQAKLVLDIANKTLPYFRVLCESSYEMVCKIICEDIHAEVVALTDRVNINGIYSRSNKYKFKNKEIISSNTKKVIENGSVTILEEDEIEDSLKVYFPKLKSAIIVPLKNKDKTIGTLKIYFNTHTSLIYRNKFLAVGLSELISTQLEISRVEALKSEAAKAEIKALQAQINPHFLFNVLHTIASFLRIDPSKARKIIIDLSTYLRYSIESVDRFVTIEKELEQVKAYIGIEEARYYNKFDVYYDVDETLLSLKIPSLIIQPLVENAIHHGIIRDKVAGNIWVRIKRLGKSKAREK